MITVIKTVPTGSADTYRSNLLKPITVDDVYGILVHFEMSEDGASVELGVETDWDLINAKFSHLT